MTKALLKRLEEGKLYYSISEVCQITGLEQHVLRYWESEFPQLKPKKNRAGNRAYRAKEIKLVRYIKYLLYDEMYTIQGAKRKITEVSAPDLEGQINLLGGLPGLGAALPTPSAEPTKRRKTKATLSATVAPTAAAATEPETEPSAMTSEADAIEVSTHASVAPSLEPEKRRELLLELKRELRNVLHILKVAP